MLQHAIDLNVNPSDETTLVCPRPVFPITREGASSRDAALEISGPGAQPVAVPTPNPDQCKETVDGADGVLTWTVNERQSDAGPGQAQSAPCGAIHGFDNQAYTSWIRTLGDRASGTSSAVFPAKLAS